MFKRRREVPAPETVEMHVAGLAEPVRLPAGAVRAIAGRLMPILLERGSATLTFGKPGIQSAGPASMATEMPVYLGAERPHDLIPGSGRQGSTKALDAMISARFDALLAAKARQLAAADNVGFSDWLRGVVEREIERRTQPVGWYCQHAQIGRGFGGGGGGQARLVSASCGHGCEMQPVYEVAS
jgi:hypothetical protein